MGKLVRGEDWHVIRIRAIQVYSVLMKLQVATIAVLVLQGILETGVSAVEKLLAVNDHVSEVSSVLTPPQAINVASVLQVTMVTESVVPLDEIHANQIHVLPGSNVKNSEKLTAVVPAHLERQGMGVDANAFEHVTRILASQVSNVLRKGLRTDVALVRKVTLVMGGLAITDEHAGIDHVTVEYSVLTPAVATNAAHAHRAMKVMGNAVQGSTHASQTLVILESFVQKTLQDTHPAVPVPEDSLEMAEFAILDEPVVTDLATEVCPALTIRTDTNVDHVQWAFRAMVKLARGFEFAIQTRASREYNVMMKRAARTVADHALQVMLGMGGPAGWELLAGKVLASEVSSATTLRKDTSVGSALMDTLAMAKDVLGGTLVIVTLVSLAFNALTKGTASTGVDLARD